MIDFVAVKVGLGEVAVSFLLGGMKLVVQKLSRRKCPTESEAEDPPAACFFDKSAADQVNGVKRD